MHDLSYKLHPSFTLTTNRNDPSYRVWMKSKLKKINTEQNLITSFDEESFVEEYLKNVDPRRESSIQKEIEHTCKMTLLGPGYYNVSHAT